MTFHEKCFKNGVLFQILVLSKSVLNSTNFDNFIVNLCFLINFIKLS